jgi:flagellar biosynthesis protein FlhF
MRLVRGGGVEILAARDRRDPDRLAVSASVPQGGAAPADTLRAEVAALRKLFVQFGGGRLLPPSLGPFYERLVSGGVEPSLALRLLAELPAARQGEGDSEPVLPEREVDDALAGLIRTIDPAPRPGAARLALVGPAGAGKTTTLAQLAARAQIGGGRTDILNLDGSGFGVPALLETFAAILDVPYAAALTEEDLLEKVRRAPGSGLTLIDTPGLGPGDGAGLARLRDLLRAARADEVHLVLPATSKTADALAAVRAFSALGVSHLLFTHLDETSSCGSVLTVSVETGLALSYFGTGREIPGDLLPAAAREVVQRTLRQGECLA